MADMMMWYVELDKKNTIITAEQGKEALKHFKAKYNQKPNVFFVNPKQKIEEMENVEVILNDTVLMSHLYVAENENDINPEKKGVIFNG